MRNRRQTFITKVKMNTPFTIKRFAELRILIACSSTTRPDYLIFSTPSLRRLQWSNEDIFLGIDNEEEDSPSQVRRAKEWVVASRYQSTLITPPPLPIYVITLLSILLPSAVYDSLRNI